MFDPRSQRERQKPAKRLKVKLIDYYQHLSDLAEEIRGETAGVPGASDPTNW